MAVYIQGIQVYFPTRNTAISITLTTDDYRINVTDTTAVRTITIPASIVSAIGTTFEIWDTSGAAGATPILLDTAGAEKINKVNDSITCVAKDMGHCQVVSDGTNWVCSEA